MSKKHKNLDEIFFLNIFKKKIRKKLKQKKFEKKYFKNEFFGQIFFSTSKLFQIFFDHLSILIILPYFYRILDFLKNTVA
jgi:hypothetical protein